MPAETLPPAEIVDVMPFSLSRRSFSALAMGALVPAGGLRAQGRAPLPLVEMFTSQGCSSSPPADALLLEMSRQSGTVALTYPVEIWNYLGWRDTLAKPAFTRRQKAYAATLSRRQVYTPQAVINGGAHCVGSDLNAISRLKVSTMRASGARLELDTKGDEWSASAILPAGQAQAARLILLPIVSQQSVQIGRGENSGRTITYANVVRDLIDLGPIGGAERKVQITRKDFAIDKADGFALLLQVGAMEAPAVVLASALMDPAGIKT